MVKKSSHSKRTPKPPKCAILLTAFYNHGKYYPMEDSEVNSSAFAGLNSSLIASNNGRIPAFS